MWLVSLGLLLGGASPACNHHPQSARPNAATATEGTSGGEGSGEPAADAVDQAHRIAQRDAVLVAVLCEAYADWPAAALDETRCDELEARARAARADVDALAPVDGAVLAGRAASDCPDVIPVALVAGRGLPGPFDLPGVYPATQPQTPDESRSRLAWAAVGLGCAGLGEGTDEELLAREADLLTALGMTLDEYVQAALDQDDPLLGDLIVSRILQCARRARADVLE